MLFPDSFLMKKIPSVLFPEYSVCPICLRAIKSDATIPLIAGSVAWALKEVTKGFVAKIARSMQRGSTIF